MTIKEYIEHYSNFDKEFDKEYIVNELNQTYYLTNELINHISYNMIDTYLFSEEQAQQLDELLTTIHLEVKKIFTEEGFYND